MWIAVLLVAVTLAGIAVSMLSEDSEAPAGSLEIERMDPGPPPRVIEVASSTDADELSASAKVSPVYEVKVRGGARGSFVLRFEIPPGVDHSHLAVATREAEDEMWTLREGRVAGSNYVVHTPSLSFWQLRELEERAVTVFARAKRAAEGFFAGVSQTLGVTTRPARCRGSVEDLVLTERDPEDLVLGPCMEPGPDRTRVRVANNLGLALELGISKRLQVEEVRGGTLAEAVWEEINHRLSANSAAIVPGSGQVATGFVDVPQELVFRPTSSAYWIDASLTWMTKGKGTAAKGAAGSIANFSECVYSVTDGIGNSDPGGLDQLGAALWADCGGHLGETPFAVEGAAIFDIFKLGRATLDLPHLGSTAVVRVDRSTVGIEADAEELAEQGASCGVLAERFLASGNPVSVDLGVVGGQILCSEAQSVVREYFTTNECVDAGNTCVLQIGKYTCAAPTLGFYPRAVDCTDGRLRIVGISTDAVSPIGDMTQCGTPARILAPGPYEVSANVPCRGAQRLAIQMTNVPCIDHACRLLPFVCETKVTGWESARHRCVFGRVVIGFATGA